MKEIKLVLLPLTIAALMLLGSVNIVQAGDDPVLILPEPQKAGGMPLMEALSKRHSNRNFRNKALEEQQISNLLWAAWGINREDGRHTSPTAMNKQEVLVFVAKEDGVWRYAPEEHALTRVLETDMRTNYKAPLTLLYAAPTSRRYHSMHLGAIFQNAGLYCASVGLANVVKGTGQEDVKEELPLPEGYRVQIVQSIGWPGD